MWLWSQDAFVSAMALSLLHSLWQGALLGIVGLALHARLTRATPDTRYGVFSLLLFTFFAVWLGAFCWLYADAASPRIVSADIPIRLAFSQQSAPASAFVTHSVVRPLLQSVAPWLVAVWAGGVCLLSLRCLGGFLLLRRLCRMETALCLPEWEDCAARMAAKMGIRRKIVLRGTTRLDVPCAFGLLKSTILLPVSVMLGLPPEQAEALIAHELAHLARHDVWFNLVQVCMETLLFYHPVVWWFSGQIRIAREQRCDDLAVEVVGSRALYARALYSLEEARTSLPQVALGAKGSASAMAGRHLLVRIRRVLGVSSLEKREPWAKGALALGAATFGLAALLPLRTHFPLIQSPAKSGAAPFTKQKPLPQTVAMSLPNRSSDKFALVAIRRKSAAQGKVPGQESRSSALPLPQQRSGKAAWNLRASDAKPAAAVKINHGASKGLPALPRKVNDKEGPSDALTAQQPQPLPAKLPVSDANNLIAKAGGHEGAFTSASVSAKILIDLNGDKIELAGTDLMPDTAIEVNGEEERFGDLNAARRQQIQQAMQAIPKVDVNALVAKAKRQRGLITTTATQITRILIDLNGDKIESSAAEFAPDTPIKINGKEKRFSDLTAPQQMQLQRAAKQIASLDLISFVSRVRSNLSKGENTSN